ncbi:S8 family serine peptidase [Jidongwangia harbinensis]|uniref:S8 family serine peptidase n=1 Tax=Jidongwangia harbinensis TaxID=2878561 RepID=UPI001CD9AC51|nr:S8 family serine peptidase [Jidongwangia harbinensis]MCA2211288.1 S8 family serine peptidase [Jidongwangia harbinensis]
MRESGNVARAAAGLAFVLVVGTAGPAGAEPGPPAVHPGTGPERTVTLITGDQVTVGRDGRALRTRPAPGRGTINFMVQHAGERLLVVPSDAARLVAAGRLDERLFDVTGLLADGYGDADRDDLGLIMTGSSRAAAATRGLRVTAQLPVVDGSVARIAKADAPAAWRSLAAAGGKIWLDGMRRPLLEQSVPQIGAPAAWQAGLTGKGVTVAVLDTGIDTTHPDLAGQVTQARSFVSGEPGDAVGHGTHVASTIAGTGAAAQGRFRGVAPEASLLNGRVCGPQGCPDSAVLAGMEWAAQQRARVINLSLGGPDDAGTDPIEEAVNRLTERTGALFVVAAGNTGECSVQDKVASPASAQAALAVGAVNRDDSLAFFSCAGPRLGDGAVKPDITAPGAGIVAARVKGTPNGDANPVDDTYARLSGTSMATPHVAGAAALLAQAHPEWTAADLKARLMASARPHPSSTVFQQGAGRVDVARALAQPLVADPPSVSLPGQPWPHADDAPVTAPITYRNDAAEPLEVALSVVATGPGGAPAPEGMFTLDTDRLTVPAGGSARVAVTVHTRVDGAEGDYSARVVATSDGETLVSTAVGAHREEESYDLTVHHIGRDGQPADVAGGFIIGNLARYLAVRYSTPRGTTTYRLPRGEFSMAALVVTARDDDPANDDVAIMGTPTIDLTRDTAVTFDARAAKPIDLRPPRPSARMPFGYAHLDLSGLSASASVGMVAQGSFQRVFSGHVGAAGDPKRFRAEVTGDWLEPGGDGGMSTSPYVYHLSYYRTGRNFDGLIRRPAASELARVHSDYAGGAGWAVATSSAAVPRGEVVRRLYLENSFRLPHQLTEYFTTEGIDWFTTVDRNRMVDGVPVYEALQSTGERQFGPGRTYRERWWSGVLGPSLLHPNHWAYQNLGSMRVTVPLHGDRPGHYGQTKTDTARTTLYRDGVKLLERPTAGQISAQVGQAAATYRLETEATQSVFDTSTRVTGSWTFASPGATSPVVYLPIMTVRADPEVDEQIRAPGGRTVQFPVTVQQTAPDPQHPDAPPAEVTGLTVDASFDDGTTWQPLRLTRTGDRWFATLRHPASGFVSLRARATDAAGNSVDQTIIRAYGLR